MSFDEQSMTLEITEDSTNNDDAGTYEIEIQLTEPTDDLSKTYTFEVIVQEAELEEPEC